MHHGSRRPLLLHRQRRRQGPQVKADSGRPRLAPFGGLGKDQIQPRRPTYVQSMLEDHTKCTSRNVSAGIPVSKCDRYSANEYPKKNYMCGVSTRSIVVAVRLGQPVELQAYAERVIIRQNAEIVCEHPRCFAYGQTISDSAMIPTLIFQRTAVRRERDTRRRSAAVLATAPSGNRVCCRGLRTELPPGGSPALRPDLLLQRFPWK